MIDINDARQLITGTTFIGFAIGYGVSKQTKKRGVKALSTSLLGAGIGLGVGVAVILASSY